MVPILLTYTVPQFVFAPLWMRLSSRVGKKRLWLASLVVTAASFPLFMPIEQPGIAIYLVAFLLGVAGGVGPVVAPSIQADIIDYDEYTTDQRKEGSYLAVWNFVRKAAGSVTALVTGWVLQGTGYDAESAQQSEEVKFAIRALFCLLPAVCYAIGALLFTRFSLGEAEHTRIRRVLDERAGARGRPGG